MTQDINIINTWNTPHGIVAQAATLETSFVQVSQELWEDTFEGKGEFMVGHYHVETCTPLDSGMITCKIVGVDYHNYSTPHWRLAEERIKCFKGLMQEAKPDGEYFWCGLNHQIESIPAAWGRDFYVRYFGLVYLRNGKHSLASNKWVNRLGFRLRQTGWSHDPYKTKVVTDPQYTDPQFVEKMLDAIKAAWEQAGGIV